MARKQRNLAKTVAAMAATALVEKAIQKAAKDPRVRRKAKAVGKALKKRAKAAGKKISKAIKKRASSRRGLRARSPRR
ncbi:MAG: hypothetical protein QOH59_2811 [Gemmatimonadales bacterium]|jgi:hypothetical protein|nr:hypothetical protein [Gemmatimonadales bacterium]